MPSDVTTATASISAELPEPQAVLQPLTTSAIFLVLTVASDDDAAVRKAISTVADIGSLTRAVGFREPTANLSCVVGIGSELWDRIHPEGAPRPSELHPFTPITGAKHNAPATPGDLLLHIRANRQDLAFELARLTIEALGDSATVVSSTSGFRYFDSRDLLGFVDGTENPTGRAVTGAALISEQADPQFAGGSYVIVQKYVHDLAAWNRLSTEEQERVIGRTKVDDVELADGVQPTNSHLALNTVTDANGVEQSILRDNMAFGDPATGEYGTFYIAYSGQLWVTELMLQRMFVGEPPGNSDRILDVSTAVTGSLFFVPPLAMLEALPDAFAPSESQPAAPPTNSQTSSLTDPGSLGIGSLKRATS